MNGRENISPEVDPAIASKLRAACKGAEHFSRLTKFTKQKKAVLVRQPPKLERLLISR